MNKISDLGQITYHLCFSFLSFKQGYNSTHLRVIGIIYIIINKTLEQLKCRAKSETLEALINSCCYIDKDLDYHSSQVSGGVADKCSFAF